MTTPGSYLESKLAESGMSRKELAQRINVSEKHISTVINGEKGISASFARKLGYVFAPTSFWLDVQARYDEEQGKLIERNSITKEEIGVLSHFHDILPCFIEKGFIHNNCGDGSKVMQLREFLCVSDLLQIPKVTYNAAYRAQLATNIKIDPYVLFAWQRLCEKETENINTCDNLDVDKLEYNIKNIKAMMFGTISDGIRDLQNFMAECGIAFAVVKNFRGAPVQGFIKETTNHRLILCLTIRRKRADVFWFTLFHEIAHILNGDYSSRFVDFDSVHGDMEEKADLFAMNTLIDPESYRRFLQSRNCTEWDEIEKFANRMGVKPYIILGRLQNDGILDWSDYSERLERYSWA